MVECRAIVEYTSNGCLGGNVRVSEMTLVPLCLFPYMAGCCFSRE